MSRHLSPDVLARLNAHRGADGKFGDQPHSAPPVVNTSFGDDLADEALYRAEARALHRVQQAFEEREIAESGQLAFFAAGRCSQAWSVDLTTKRGPDGVVDRVAILGVNDRAGARISRSKSERDNAEAAVNRLPGAARFVDRTLPGIRRQMRAARPGETAANVNQAVQVAIEREKDAEHDWNCAVTANVMNGLRKTAPDLDRIIVRVDEGENGAVVVPERFVDPHGYPLADRDTVERQWGLTTSEWHRSLRDHLGELGGRRFELAIDANGTGSIDEYL